MEQHFTTPGRVVVEVDVPAGDISFVEGQDGTTAVEIQPDSVASDVEVEHRDRGGEHLVRIGMPKKRRFFTKGRLDIRITCASGTHVLARAASADLRASMALGDVTVQTASGDVLIGDVAGDLNVKSASGDLVVGRVGGVANIHSVSGDCALKGVEHDLTITSVSGDLQIGEVADGEVTIRSVSGDIRVGVRQGVQFHLDAKTTSGDARSEFDLDGAPSPAAEDATGQLDLRVNSLSGDIRIVRATAH
jgi:DUF4097 and DUF4098 domain-containing protein YvlB